HSAICQVMDSELDQTFFTFGYYQEILELIHILQQYVSPMGNDLRPMFCICTVQRAFHQPKVDRTLIGQNKKAVIQSCHTVKHIPDPRLKHLEGSRGLARVKVPGL